jgi:cyclic pyranopterin phosphate synthase
MSAPPIDSHQRRIDYLRLSITDRCNLRCLYCMPQDGLPKLSHEDILRYEEILRLTRIVIGMGISKVRITGGEPLVRRDALFLCESIARLPGLKSLSVTTNAVLLAQYAGDLFQAGVKRINISLDTLKPEKYAFITRRDCFREVWRGIEAAHRAGFFPIKLNTVVMRGVNDDEIEELAQLTVRYPFHVRFIEFMPVNGEASDSDRRFIAADEILQRLQRIGSLAPVLDENSNGPARHYQFAGASGRIGLISPISHHFCPSCNRLRLTSDGKLRACLFATQEYDLQTPLRQGVSDADLIAIIRSAIAHKPARHALEQGGQRKCISRPMVAIGG